MGGPEEKLSMTGLTRRRFLEESMLATAAAAASSALVVPQLGADETPSSPNETIQHAVLGCRIRGKVHADVFAKQPGVVIRYVCDPDRELAEELATAVEKQQGRRPQAVQDLRVIMDDPAVDTVSIASPNHWHALSAIWAMQAGKDVYVEKPVSNTVREGRRIVEVARETGRICQTGTQNRSGGANRATAEFVRAGKLGEISLARTIIYGRRGSIGPRGVYDVPPQVDYNLWLGPGTEEKLTRRQLHYDWHWVWDTGNGELGNNNIHYIDLVRWMLDWDGMGDSVFSIGGRMGYVDAGETPNTQMVVHSTGPTTIIQEVRGLKTSPFSEKFNAGWIIEGTEGFVAGTSLFDPEGNLVQTFQGPGEDHFGNFIRAVRSRRSEDLNAEVLEGHQSTALCHIGNISHRVGKALPPGEIQRWLAEQPYHEEVSATFQRMVEHLQENDVDFDRTPLTLGTVLQPDSSTERFVGNDEANQLLGRRYRHPFVVPGEEAGA
jgi:predicted dehydrogenase